MNKKMEKNYYNAPTVKVVSFKVEVGIQTSQEVNMGIRSRDQIINPEPDPWPGITDGTENMGIRSL